MKANKIIARCTNISDSLSSKGMNHPVLLMSGPGFGKTTTIEEYCKLRDYLYYPLIPSQSSSDDILGFQIKTTDSCGRDRIERLTPSWYNEIMEEYKATGKRICLFVDKLNNLTL